MNIYPPSSWSPVSCLFLHSPVNPFLYSYPNPPHQPSLSNLYLEVGLRILSSESWCIRDPFKGVSLSLSISPLNPLTTNSSSPSLPSTRFSLHSRPLEERRRLFSVVVTLTVGPWSLSWNPSLVYVLLTCPLTSVVGVRLSRTETKSLLVPVFQTRTCVLRDFG